MAIPLQKRLLLRKPELGLRCLNHYPIPSPPEPDNSCIVQKGLSPSPSDYEEKTLTDYAEYQEWLLRGVLKRAKVDKKYTATLDSA